MAVKIVHVMADGTIRDSMEGVVVPLTPRTRRYYEIQAEFYRRKLAEEAAKKKKQS